MNASDQQAGLSPLPSPSGTPFRGLYWVGGLAIVIAVVVAGAPALDAPWIQGDEHIFIVNNPDVTGVGPPTKPTGNRWIDIFLHTHEDLYQPLTILSYAIEWKLWPELRVMHIRVTDVLIHAINALLLWAVLAALLRRLVPDRSAMAPVVAWTLAVVWALHPMLVTAYTADMGRTHLLAATFTLLSLLAHLRAIERGGWGWFALSFLALLCAMLNKPVVGWVVVVFAIEAALLGLRRALRSPRVYLVGLMCVVFAVLTLWTTRESLELARWKLPLFGDPLTRAAVGMWIYLRNFVAPGPWLSAWVPPDVHTGWGYPLVWVGLGALGIGAVAVLRTARNERLRGVAVGLVWCVAMWLPVSGLVGARVLAAQDRYFYLPMAGLLLAIGVGLLRWAGAAQPRVRRRIFGICVLAIVLGGMALPWDRQLTRMSRSTLRRALRVARLHPDDPRVMEYLAAAYDFAHDHETPESREGPPEMFLGKMAETLERAADLAEQHPEYFADDHSRAEFHRRLSFDFWRIGRYEQSLAQARRAYDFEPDAPTTWLRLAHGYRALGRWKDARAAYEKLTQVLPPDDSTRGLRLLEFADLLLNRFNDPAEALKYYRAAQATGQLNGRTLQVAILGAARCEVLAGSGRDGFQLALAVLRGDPNNLSAAQIVALYHLRSHHWEDAARIYRELLRRMANDYECLRGYTNACAQLGTWADAASAWQRAVRAEPDNVTFRAWAVWVAACAGSDAAQGMADELLERRPHNRFACLARMLVALRAGDPTAAVAWLRRAEQGPALPLAREYVRAEMALRLLAEQKKLPPEATLLRALLLARRGDGDTARGLVTKYLQENPTGPGAHVARELLANELRPGATGSAPSSQPG